MDGCYCSQTLRYMAATQTLSVPSQVTATDPPKTHTLSHCHSLTSTHHTKNETTATVVTLTPSDYQLLLLLLRRRRSAAASKHAAQALWAEEFLEGCERVVGDLCLWRDDGQALSLGKVTGAALVLLIGGGGSRTAVQQQPWWSEVRGSG